MQTPERPKEPRNPLAKTKFTTALGRGLEIIPGSVSDLETPSRYDRASILETLTGLSNVSETNPASRSRVNDITLGGIESVMELACSVRK